ncbi:MAG: diphosphate--fructose-6-phosphate 1-phosphotransferase [Planctomycetes bacterium]|nr:diphosphate--fructose-6-phosphate 1-phosphotransferase [Planctomycetota bacterium]
MPEVLSGNAVVFTQGGPTAVINASWVGVVEGLKGAKEISGIYGSINGIDGILNQNLVDLAAQDPKTLQAISRTPATQLLSTRHKPTEEDNAAMLVVFKKQNIRYVFGIGGNDTSESLDIIRDAAVKDGYELRFFHIAKTVDCDLKENDHTPGYASAARYVANALRGCDLDNQCFGGFYLAVCMGRHAGFLTAASALGRVEEKSGPHLVYVPEAPFDIDRFCKDAWNVYAQEGRCVVAVSEGIEDKNGTPILQVLSTGKLEADSHGNVQLSGTGALADALVGKIKEYFAGQGVKNLRARGDTLGYIQRSFPDQSPVDREESLGLGKFAAQQALAGEAGGSCAIVRIADAPYQSEFRLVPLGNVAGKTRHLPAEFINQQGNNVTPDFIRWGKPLIGELSPVGILDMSKKIAKQ